MSMAPKFCARRDFRPRRLQRSCATALPKPRPAGEGIEAMDFALTANQESIRNAVGKVCARFDDGYWLKKDKEGGFPADFHKELADAGWLGICIPEAYGGSGFGVVDAPLMMRTIAESGGGVGGGSGIPKKVGGPHPGWWF